MLGLVDRQAVPNTCIAKEDVLVDLLPPTPLRFFLATYTLQAFMIVYFLPGLLPVFVIALPIASSWKGWWVWSAEPGHSSCREGSIATITRTTSRMIRLPMAMSRCSGSSHLPSSFSHARKAFTMHADVMYTNILFWCS
jgi:hypothetical protein